MPVAAELIDAIESHATALVGFDDKAVARVLEILEDLQSELRTTLLDVDPAGVTRRTFRIARLEELLAQTDRSIAAAYRKIGKEGDAHLEEAARRELEFTHANLRETLLPVKPFGVGVNTVTVSPSILRQLAQDTMVNFGEATGAAPFRHWLAGQEDATIAKFGHQMMRGLQAGESTQEMVRRVVGGKGRDPVLDVPRYQAESLVRTSSQAVTGEARRSVYAKNRHALKGIYQITTRDERTSVICIAYAGKAWLYDDAGNLVPEGHSLPYNGGVPRHGNCRSVDAPYTKGLEDMGIDPEEVPDWVRGVLDGKVGPNLDGEFILRKGGETMQHEILGPTRMALWKSGRVSLEDMLGADGTPRKVKELLALVA